MISGFLMPDQGLSQAYFRLTSTLHSHMPAPAPGARAPEYIQPGYKKATCLMPRDHCFATPAEGALSQPLALPQRYISSSFSWKRPSAFSFSYTCSATAFPQRMQSPCTAILLGDVICKSRTSSEDLEAAQKHCKGVQHFRLPPLQQLQDEG